MRRSLVATLVALLLLSGSMAYAEKPQEKITDPKKAEERLDRISETAARIWGETKSVEKMAKYLSSQGLKRVDMGGEVSTLTTTASYVRMLAPNIWWDPATDIYTIYGQMLWLKDGTTPFWTRDIPSSCDWFGCNVGKREAAGIWVDRPEYFQNVGYSLRTYGPDGGMTTFNTAADNNNAGAAFQWQDDAWGDTRVSYGYNYDTDSYLIELRLKPIASFDPRTVGVKHTYVHTWESTDVTSASISIYPPSFSYTTAPTTAKWPATSGISYFSSALIN